MNIAVDAMGGDNAPLEVVKGAINAALEYKDLNITLVGDEAKIRDISREIGVVIPNNVEILHSSSEVTMEDDPMIVMKEKKDSSMAMGLKLLKEDGVDQKAK